MIMSNLDTQCKSFNVVLNVPNNFSNFEKSLEMLNESLSRNTMFYASIKHDKDTDKNGVLKTLHYHYVITCASRKRISTMLYFIADSLGYSDSSIDLINTIQVDKCDSVPLSIQYLIHKNNSDKYQYDSKDIVTNYSDKDLQDYLLFESQEITTRYLYDLIISGKSDVEIMFIIGVGRYHLFKGCISDIRYALRNTPNLIESFLESIDNG